MDRKKVKEFFEFKKDNSNQVFGWGVILAIVGVLWFLTSPSLIALVVGGLGGALIYHSKREKFDDVSEYQAVQYFKQKDVNSLLKRAFERANVDVDELVDFQATDMMSFEDLEGASADDMSTLRNKSVILLGAPGDGKFRIKGIEVDGKIRGFEINPWQVTILFLTQTQLIAYDAALDIIRGDLNREEFHRMFLKDIVQIGTSTLSDREKVEAKDYGDRAKEFREKFGDKVEEVVKRTYLVKISKTDGQGLSFPIGAPEWRDGTVGSLDAEATDEDARYMRIAQEMSQRIDEMKRGLPAS